MKTNIESALRRRALICRTCAVVGWVMLFVLGYFYICRDFYSLRELIQDAELRGLWSGGLNLNLLIIVLPGFLLFSGAAYFLGRFCLLLNIQADKYTSLADALCLSGSSLSELEQVIKITTYNADSLSMSDIASDKDIKALVELVKETRS